MSVFPSALFTKAISSEKEAAPTHRWPALTWKRHTEVVGSTGFLGLSVAAGQNGTPNQTDLRAGREAPFSVGEHGLA